MIIFAGWLAAMKHSDRSHNAEVAGEPDGEVGGEPQDHVLVVAEPAGEAEPSRAIVSG